MAKRAQKGGLRGETIRMAWIVVMASALGICVNSFSRHPLAIFNEPEANTAPMSIEEFADALKHQDAVLLLDVRGPVEYEAEHSTLSLHVPLENLTDKQKEIAPSLENASTIVTMCDSEECGKAGDAAALLQKLGYKNVRVLKGGWEAYRHTDLPRVVGKL